MTTPLTPAALESTPVPAPRALYERVYGAKYNKDLTRVQIAAAIRADIKAAVKAGALPKAKYSVRTESYSGGGSIDVKISAVEGLSSLFNRARLEAELDDANVFHGNHPALRWLYSEEARALVAKVEAIHGAFNFDGSEIQADYFDVRYYGGVSFAWEYKRDMRAAEVEDIRHERRNEAERAEVKADLAKTQADFVAFLGVAS